MKELTWSEEKSMKVIKLHLKDIVLNSDILLSLPVNGWMSQRCPYRVPTNLMPKPNKELLFNVYGPIAIDSCFVKEVVMMVMDKAKLLAL